jgi:Ca2+-binding EF-hand superfamily protein
MRGFVLFASLSVALAEDQLGGLCIAEDSEGECRVINFKDYRKIGQKIAAPCCDASNHCLPYHPSLTGKCVKREKNPFSSFMKNKLDLNGDGTATRTEVEKFVANGSKKSWPVYGSGSLTAKDIVASIMSHDKDKDGRINESELLAVFWAFIDDTAEAGSDDQVKAGTAQYKKERNAIFSNPGTEVYYRTKHQYEKAVDNARKKAKKGTESNQSSSEKSLETQFDAQDGNGDGMLTKAEIDKWAATKGTGDIPDESFNQLDADLDGFISRKEFMALDPTGPAHRERLEKAFIEQDTDGDGMLTLDEVSKYAIDKGSPMDQEEMTSEFNKIDVDKDGKWSKEEFLESALEEESY